MKPSEDIGDLLKQLRNSKKVSIRQLARKAGVSPAIISRIEQGHSSPSFATLQKILEAFHMNFAQFFGSAQPAAQSPIIPRRMMKQIDGIGEKLKFTLVNAGYSPDIQLLLEEYAPGANWGNDMLTHESVETGICMQGELTLELAGRTHAISKGDGWCFDSRQPHRFSNRSSRKAVLVSANTPAVF